jgi:NAD-specific glutamate dehydrogenase
LPGSDEVGLARWALGSSLRGSVEHSGKDLIEILETYPRDELFQIATCF